MAMVMEMVEETMVAPTKDLWRVNLETLTELVALLTTEFCLSNEIEKLEGEFCNHSMVGADHVGYTDRFHELEKFVPHLVTPEAKRVTRYINGLPSQIHRMLRATQTATIQADILTAGILTDEVVRSGTLAKAGVRVIMLKKDHVEYATITKGRVIWPETVDHQLGMQSRYERLGQEMGRELVMSVEVWITYVQIVL
ncbi:hypothetical protein Tco_1514247, partial [Tanacetum coccineum]